MKRIIETTEDSGLDSLLGEQVFILCLNYFYTGTLAGVNETCILLENPSIVYETGAWDTPNYADVQRLHTDKWYIQRSVIESFGRGKGK